MSLFNPLELMRDRPDKNGEGMRFGRVLDPGKFTDPKKAGRVKARVPEVHGQSGSNGIPDEDIPWSQLDRPVGHGGQKQMSSFGMPQNDSIIKTRFHGNDAYSPTASGSPYSKDGPITEFGEVQGDQSGGGSGGGTMADDNGGGGDQQTGKQHKQYGYKDPLGGLFHFDMDKKEITIDLTKYKNFTLSLPKSTFNVKNTQNGDDYQADNYSGNGWGGSSGGSTSAAPAAAGQQVDGDITWNVEGAYAKTVNNTSSETVKKAVTIDHQDSHSVKIAKDMTKTIGGKRSDSVSGKWSANASSTKWSWLKNLYSSMSGVSPSPEPPDGA